MFLMTDPFYESLPRVSAFNALTDPGAYTPLPSDWSLGLSDVVASTEAIAAGRYKTVNMVGAAIISAMMNALGGRPFPFVFGGDGASFAVPSADADAARTALAAVQSWAAAEFDLTLRTALVPVTDVREAGHDVRIARFQASEAADYAMFQGGGLSWAEEQMKSGAYALPAAPPGTTPDLTGLSCRWSHMKAVNGKILSLVVVPQAEADPTAYRAALTRVIDRAARLDRGGHPAPVSGPGSDWPPPGATLEAHATRRGASLGRARRKVLVETFIAWLLIRTGLKLGGFDARRYARIVGANADFRKMDDGLKMTLDCDAATQQALEAELSEAAAQGILRYGISVQDEAMMTCIVPSFLQDDHVHFIDGASGGYTQAAALMKGLKDIV
nr:DUF3095 domain-containing protein [Thalassococcus sp. S3]